VTLVVARHIENQIFIFSDTHLVGESGQNVHVTEGVIKTVFLTPSLAVSYAGNTHFAELAISAFYSDMPSDVTAHFLHWNIESNSQTDFIVAKSIPEFCKNGTAGSDQELHLTYSRDTNQAKKNQLLLLR
jgi:hypothetical protein